MLNATKVGKLLKTMVGPWGLEPQTSTVSILKVIPAGISLSSGKPSIHAAARHSSARPASAAHCCEYGLMRGVTSQSASQNRAFEREKNRVKSKVRPKVEHMFAVIKLKFGYMKVRYKGLAKNAHRLFVTCALANLYMVRKKLLCPTAA
jgi:hypothetical protein